MHEENSHTDSITFDFCFSQVLQKELFISYLEKKKTEQPSISCIFNLTLSLFGFLKYPLQKDFL